MSFVLNVFWGRYSDSEWASLTCVSCFLLHPSFVESSKLNSKHHKPYHCVFRYHGLLYGNQMAEKCIFFSIPSTELDLYSRIWETFGYSLLDDRTAKVVLETFLLVGDYCTFLIRAKYGSFYCMFFIKPWFVHSLCKSMSLLLTFSYITSTGRWPYNA